jgi:Primosomal protein N'' (replication factor Y) - superfamily II helicase
MSEHILRQEAGVKVHESESPPIAGLKAGVLADIGTLILTNERLVYIKKGRTAKAAAFVIAGRYGGIVAKAIEDRVSKANLDELSRHEGGISIPLVDLTRVEADTQWGVLFICVYSTGTPKPAYSFVVNGGTDKEDWVTTINRAKTSTAQNPFDSQLETPSTQWVCRNCGITSDTAKACDFCGEPLTMETKARVCPYCGHQTRYIQQYQRWYCDNEKRYV